MLDPYQKKFWDNFKRENLVAIGTLIREKHDVAALKLICSAIDALAGFYTGRTAPGAVRESFEIFLKRYMERFFDYNFSAELNFRISREDVNPGSILYTCFRNGAIHDGSLGLGISIYRDPNIKVLWKAEGIQIMNLNITGFWEYFKKALDDYEEDLKKDRQIYGKFVEKYQEIYQPIFVLKTNPNKGKSI